MKTINPGAKVPTSQVYKKVNILTFKVPWRVLFIGSMLIVFSNCTTDNIEPNTNSKPVTIRTCEPGEYSISNGRIVFDDHDEFLATMDFLSCSTEEEIAEWSSELGIETTGGAFRDFTDIICDEELSDIDYSSAKSSYSSKVIVSVDGDGVESFEPLFKIYNEFLNLDGEFQVDTTIIKIAGSNFINITKPSLVNVASIDDETETDTVKGVYVHNLFPSSSMGGCCPEADGEINIWANNPRRRLRIDYWIYNASQDFVDEVHPGRTIYFPVIGVTARGVSQTRRGWLIHWWTCNRVTMSQNFAIDFSHNFGPWGITSPITTSDFQGGVLNTCRLDFNREWHVFPPWSIFDWQIPTLEVCVDEVEHDLTNTIPNPDIVVDLDCQ